MGSLAMTGTTNSDINLVIHGGSNQICIDSRDLAKEFGRAHKNVLQTLDDLLADGTVSRLESKPRNYRNRGKDYRCFELNKAGFLKAMPFIGGKKSREGQKRLVDEFLKLELKLERQSRGREKLSCQIADLIKSGLTDYCRAATIAPLSPHAAVWFGHHELHKMPKARLIRRLCYHTQKIIYGGRCLGRESVQGSCALLTNPDNVHRPIFGQISGVLKHSQEVITMSQNNSAHNSGQTTQTFTNSNLEPAKSNTCASASLLDKLQQDIDLTMAALSDAHLERYGYALDRIQQTIKHFNRPDTDGCTQQVADLLGFQLEEIREAAQKYRA